MDMSILPEILGALTACGAAWVWWELSSVSASLSEAMRWE
jgi:hypothetical protein